MEQSPSREAYKFSANQDILRVLWNWKLLLHSQGPVTWLHCRPATSLLFADTLYSGTDVSRRALCTGHCYSLMVSYEHLKTKQTMQYQIDMRVFVSSSWQLALFGYPDWGFSRAFSSVVMQMPVYKPQRRGTAPTLPKCLCCSIYCLFCIVLCIFCV